MTLLTICWEFFKTGLFAVGGGLATLPFLTAIQAKYQWFTVEDLGNMIAVSESTPGPIGVNMATYVGYRTYSILGGITYGILGGIIATLSLVLPSLIVILLIAKALDKYRNNILVKRGFAFMRPAVTGLIAAAGFSVLKIALFHNKLSLDTVSWPAVVMFIVLLTMTQIKKLKKLHPIVYIVISAAVGIILKMG